MKTLQQLSSQPGRRARCAWHTRRRAHTRHAVPWSACPAAARRRLLRPLQAAEQQATAAATKGELQRALDEAVRKEDYRAAAKLRDQIRELEEEDSLEGLRSQLEEAVKNECYEEAARLRDELKRVVAETSDLSSVPTTSDTVTEGVRVKAHSFFVPEQSSEERGLWFYAYRITITNEGDTTVLLRNRKWFIVDADKKMEMVSGSGVVGEQPILNPGQSFEYTSACPLRTKFGTMAGAYEFTRLQEDGTWSEVFDVQIGRFGLRKE